MVLRRQYTTNKRGKFSIDQRPGHVVYRTGLIDSPMSRVSAMAMAVLYVTASSLHDFSRYFVCCTRLGEPHTFRRVNIFYTKESTDRRLT